MDYRNLGRAGLKVSEICLGTMTFGNGADQAGASRMVDTALAAGVNFFDTANSYVGGTSETMLGEALKGKRHEAVIASKLFNPMDPRPNDSGMSRLHIKQQVEDSLRTKAILVRNRIALAEILQALLDVAKEIGRSPAQVALRWVMDQPFMTSAIVGARNAEQLGETLQAGGWRLPAEALGRLNKVSARPWRYPRAFEEPMPERRQSAIKMPAMK